MISPLDQKLAVPAGAIHPSAEKWGEQAELHFARLAGLRAEGEREHGGLRRVRGDLKLQELEEEFAVGGGEGGADGALIGAVAVELHCDGE